MTIREFINALCKVEQCNYSLDYAKEVLRAATDNDTAFSENLDAIDESIIRSYLRKDRNLSVDLAHEIRYASDESISNDEYDPDCDIYMPKRDLFGNMQVFLLDMLCKEGARSRACTAFEQWRSDISEQNAVDVIAKLFEQLIDDILKGAPPKPQNNVSVKDRNEIRKLIVDIRLSMDSLIENAGGMLWGSEEGKAHSKADFDTDYKTFRELNQYLSDYATIYPDKLEIINEALLLSKLLDFSVKLQVREGTVCLVQDPRIEEYRRYLNKIICIIFNKPCPN